MFKIRLPKISRMWLIIIIVILAIIGYFVLKSAFKSPLDAYTIQTVGRGEVSQEISETGSVRATENISMGFKTAGRISSINVSVGDNVKKGDALASLDSSQLSAQLQNYRAALDAAKMQYEKLINGLTPEDIKTYENAVTSAENDLKSSYESAMNTLRDAYTKIYNASTVTVSVQNNYFSPADQEGIKVFDSRKDLEANMQKVKNLLDSSDTDSAISQTLVSLDNIFNDLKIIREQCDLGVYYTKVSSTDKTSLDTQRGYVNTAKTNVIADQQSIASYKIALKKAQDNLSLETASARPEDIAIYKAQVEQAQANVNLYQSQLNDNFLRSPINGKITDVNAKPGEVASPNEAIINLLSLEPFQIKVNIYEQDIVNVRVGNSVKINLVAFPREAFEGKVLSIDPGEKIVDNVVYYEVTIDFPGQPEAVMSGMTADIVIETNKKENVIRVPKSVVQNIDSKEVLQAVKNGKIETREIITGIEGNDYYEVVSGLDEGDKIILGKK